jgi:tetratricopeptide (TPR) repeat protein
MKSIKFSILFMAMVGILPMNIGVAQPSVNNDRGRLEQRTVSQTRKLSLQSSSCLPAPEAGTKVYEYMIYNDMSLRRADLSSVPYQEAYQRKPNDPAVSLALGDAFLVEYLGSINEIGTERRSRFYKDIIDVYQNTLRLTRDDILSASASLGLGRMFTLKGEYDRAIEYYQSALQTTKKLRPFSSKDTRDLESDVHVGLGVALGGLCEHDKALEAYLTAVDLKPDSPDIDFINLSGLLKERNRLSDMIAIYQRAMERGSDEDFSLADLFIKLKRFNDAEVIYRKLITSDVKGMTHYYYLGLGDALKGQGNKGEAMSAYQNAADKYVPDGNFAWTPKDFQRRGLLDLAIVVQRKELSNVASSDLPMSIVGHVYMGELLEQKGDVCGAIMEYEKALETKIDSQNEGELKRNQKSAKSAIVRLRLSCSKKSL